MSRNTALYTVAEDAIAKGDIDRLVDVWGQAKYTRDEEIIKLIEESVPSLRRRFSLTQAFDPKFAERLLLNLHVLTEEISQSIGEEQLRALIKDRIRTLQELSVQLDETSFERFVRLYDQMQIQRFLKKDRLDALQQYIVSHGQGVAFQVLEEVVIDVRDPSLKYARLVRHLVLLKDILLKLDMRKQKNREFSKVISQSFRSWDNPGKWIVKLLERIITLEKSDSLEATAQSWLTWPGVIRNFRPEDRADVYKALIARYGEVDGKELIREGERIEAKVSLVISGERAKTQASIYMKKHGFMFTEELIAEIKEAREEQRRENERYREQKRLEQETWRRQMEEEEDEAEEW